MTDFYFIAEIERLVGNKGFVKVKPVSEYSGHFFKMKYAYLDFWGDKKKFVIEEIKVHGKGFLFKFKNFDERRDSQVLIGRKIFTDKKELVKLTENKLFIHDLTEAEVFIGNDKIGVIKDLLKLPANDVLVIRQQDGKEKLIPFVLQFIDKFDVSKRKLSLKIDKDFLEEEDED